MRWVIVLIFLILMTGYIIYSLIRDRKQGKHICGHGCQGCAMQGQCHNNKQDG